MQITLFQDKQTLCFYRKDIPAEEIQALLDNDKTVKQIAKKYGVSPKTIREKIKKYNLKLPSQKLRDCFEKEALPLIQQGISPINIRKITGLQQGYVYRKIREKSFLPRKELFNQQIIELYQKNCTDEEIAQALHVKVDTIQKRRTELGLGRNMGRPAKYTNITEILAELKNGTAVKTIIEKYNITKQTLYLKIKNLTGYSPKQIETEYRKQYIENCLKQGDDISTIASKINLTKKEINNFIKIHLKQKNKKLET